MRNYVNFFKYFDITLVVIPVTSGSITITLFIPVGLITSCITTNFTLSNGRAKPFLNKFKRKRK